MDVNGAFVAFIGCSLEAVSSSRRGTLPGDSIKAASKENSEGCQLNG
jgi:hypothetical protein